MKNKIVALFATLVMALGLTTAVAPPANAGWPGGSVDYWKYYGGPTRYMVLFCNDDGGKYISLWPGQWSKNEGGCADVNGIHVHVGAKLFCGERYGLRSYVYYPGYHPIGNFAYRACEMRAHAGSA